MSSLKATLFFLSVQLLCCFDDSSHPFLLKLAVVDVVAERIQVVKFPTTDTSLTEMVGRIIHGDGQAFDLDVLGPCGEKVLGSQGIVPSGTTSVTVTL